MQLVFGSKATQVRSEKGQGLAEYALILGLVGVLAVAALLFLGGEINDVLSTVANAI